MEKLKETNELINLINLNGIKLLLDKECIASLSGLLIGLENGLVISGDKDNKDHLKKFLLTLDK